MVTVLIDKPHEALVIEANSRIDVHAPPLPDASASLPWEEVRALAFASTGMEANGRRCSCTRPGARRRWPEIT
jgi:hypothetical protein